MLIIYLDSEPRSAFQDFYGHSGKTYRFTWSEEFRSMVFTGEPINAEKFSEVAADIFRATPDQNFCRPVPRIVGKLAAPAAPQPTKPEDAPAPQKPPVTVEV